MRYARLILPGAVLLLSACADRSSAPTAVAPPDGGVRNVVPNGAADDGPALQTALDQGGTILLRGEYDIYGPLYIRHSNTHIFGDRTTSLIRQHTSSTPVIGSSVFVTPEGVFLDSITVDSVRFVGPEYPLYQGTRTGLPSPASAVYVHLGRNVKVRHNNVQNMGVLIVRHEYGDINSYYKTLTSETQLSSNIEASDNTAVGRSSGFSYLWGISVGFSADVNILRNDVRNFWGGIQWLGGNAAPDDNGGTGNPGNPRWARRFHIEGNTVLNTEAGLWGGMGQDITVIRNYVDGCTDVCLDAEGSINVLFTENHARNAGHAILDVFYYSKNVTFSWNDVRQEGSYSGFLFHTHNGTQDPADITITAHNNTFRHMPASGVGVIGKESSKLVFDNNTLENVVIDMVSGNNGGTQMRGNTINLDRWTGDRPAVRVGHSHGPWGSQVAPVNDIYQVEIAGNDIYSTVFQGVRGIYVDQYAENRVNTWIHSNTIREFDPSIDVWGQGTTHYFRIENNQRTHAITYSGNPTPEVFLYNNTWISSTTDPPPGGGCDDPTVIIC